MKLSRQEVVGVLVNALREAQQDLSEELETIDEGTRPIGDLKAFDSLASVQVAVHCLDALDIGLTLSFPSLFIGRQNNALTVGEVADRIMKLQK